MAFALEEVHPVEPEAFDLHYSVCGAGLGFGGRGIDVEGGGWAGAIFDVCGEWMSASRR